METHLCLISALATQATPELDESQDCEELPEPLPSAEEQKQALRGDWHFAALLHFMRLFADTFRVSLHASLGAGHGPPIPHASCFHA